MSAEILQEFLVKLGYGIDAASNKKFSSSLAAAGKAVGVVGGQVAGLARAAEIAVREYAVQMEKLNYTSVLTKSSAASINNVSKAMQQFGIDGGAVEGMVTSFAGKVASTNGALDAYAASLGAIVSPDKAQEFLSLLKALESKPEALAIGLAQAFGIPEDSYRLVRGHIDEIIAKQENLKKMQEAMNLDLDGSVKRGKEYANVMADIKNDYDTISSKVLDTGLKVAIPIARNFEQIIHDMFLTSSEVSEELKAKGMAKEAEMSRVLAAAKYTGASSEPQTLEQKREYLKSIDRQLGIPEGTTASVWQQESGSGKHMTSGAGAMGHFQFMPQTAAQYGLKDPNNFKESAEAFGRYMGDLLKHFQGNLSDALSAYNMGESGYRKVLAGKRTLPEETANYAPEIMARRLGTDVAGGGRSVTVNQTNTFNAHGADSTRLAEKTAAKVGEFSLNARYFGPASS